jgi:hypothetical protein
MSGDGRANWSDSKKSIVTSYYYFSFWGRQKDHRRSVPLPATTAATAETTRKEASRVIGGVLQILADY